MILKFGFDQFYEDNDAYPSYHLENFIIDDKFQPFDVEFKIADYKIVHQLQNLFFALKGKELTLK